MLWFDAVGRMRMERMERNGKWQLWPFHAHTTHHVKPQHLSRLYMVISQYRKVLFWNDSPYIIHTLMKRQKLANLQYS